MSDRIESECILSNHNASRSQNHVTNNEDLCLTGPEVLVVLRGLPPPYGSLRCCSLCLTWSEHRRWSAVRGGAYPVDHTRPSGPWTVYRTVWCVSSSGSSPSSHCRCWSSPSSMWQLPSNLWGSHERTIRPGRWGSVWIPWTSESMPYKSNKTSDARYSFAKNVPTF